MQRLEISCAVRRIYTSLDAKGFKRLERASGFGLVLRFCDTLCIPMLTFIYHDATFNLLFPPCCHNIHLYPPPSKYLAKQARPTLCKCYSASATAALSIL